MITKTTMVIIFNLQNSHLLTLSLAKEVFQVNGQNRPVANLPVVDFHSQPREMKIRLSRHSVRSKNERRCFYHSQSKVVCRNLYGLWLLKHWKIRIAYRQERSNFPRRGRKPKYGKKTESWVLSGLVMAFRAAENENRQLEDLPQADFWPWPERFLLSPRTK